VLLEYVRGLSFKICNPLFKFDERNNPSLNVDKTCKGCGLSSIQSTGQNRVYGPHANIEKISHRRVFWQSKIHTDRPVVFSSADLTKGPGAIRIGVEVAKPSRTGGSSAGFTFLVFCPTTDLRHFIFVSLMIFQIRKFESTVLPAADLCKIVHPS
jgi:hypothetical protein